MRSVSKKLAIMSAVVLTLQTVASAGTLTWTGAASANWNAIDANWTGDATIYTAQNQNVGFEAAGDDVIFTDNFAGPTSIAVSALMNPNSITFADAGAGVTNYNFTGASPFGLSIVDPNDAPNRFPMVLTLDAGFNGKVTLNVASHANGRGWTNINGGILELANGASLPTNGSNAGFPGDVTLNGGSLYISNTTAGPGTTLLQGNLFVTENSIMGQSGTSVTNNQRIWGQTAAAVLNISPNKTLSINTNVSNTTGQFADLGANMASSSGTLSLGTTGGLLRFTTTQVGGTAVVYDAGTTNGTFRSTMASGSTMQMGMLTGGANTRLEGTNNGAQTYSIGTKPNSNGTFAGTIVDGHGNQTVFAAAANPTSITKAGATSTLTLGGNNTFGGQVFVAGGTLKMGNAGALGTPLASGAVNGANGNLVNPYSLGTIKGTSIQASPAVTGTLDLNGFSLAQEPLAMTGGVLTNTSGTAATLSADSVAGFQVTAIGSGYTSAPSVVVSGNATATASMGLGNFITLTNGGTRYRGNSSGVTLAGGGGTGASVVISYGMTNESFTTSNATAVGGIAANNVGAGYVPNAQIPVTISAPTQLNLNIPNVTATGYAQTNASGQVTNIVITNAGSGYIDSPATVTIPAPAGVYLDPLFVGTPVQAVAARAQAVNGNVNDRNWLTIVGLYVPTPGVGYSSVPTVTMPTPTVIAGSVTATASTNASSFVVTGVQINSVGSGYAGSTPTVTLSGGGGTGAVIQAVAPTLTLNVPAAGAPANQIGGNAGDMLLSLNVLGSGGFDKIGSNSVVLSGTNSYGGTTNVNAGKLFVNGMNTGAGAVNVASGGTLGGTGSIAGAVSIAAGGFLSPGASIETLAAGSADIDGTLVIEYDTTTADVLNVAGTLDITNATLDLNGLAPANAGPLFAYIIATYGNLVGGSFASVLDVPAGYSVNYAYQGNNIALVIPEPTSIAAVAGLACMALRRRRA
jgi:fibronectin-binding autotransporter adhesin